MKREMLVLRSQSKAYLSEDDVEKMLQKPEFTGGVAHFYELREKDGSKLVIDHITGLVWQQSGSCGDMKYIDAENYIRDLNHKRFSDYDDWRLPTLKEAVSLVESSKKHGDLYIDPVFDKIQRWIWTADKKSAGVAWFVDFLSGCCDHDDVGTDDINVRAVR